MPSAYRFKNSCNRTILPQILRKSDLNFKMSLSFEHGWKMQNAKHAFSEISNIFRKLIVHGDVGVGLQWQDFWWLNPWWQLRCKNGLQSVDFWRNTPITNIAMDLSVGCNGLQWEDFYPRSKLRSKKGLQLEDFWGITPHDYYCDVKVGCNWRIFEELPLMTNIAM